MNYAHKLHYSVHVMELQSGGGMYTDGTIQSGGG